MAFRKYGLSILLVLLGSTLFRCIWTKGRPFLSDLACQPPCWQNIDPGVTTEEEALQILKNLSNIDQPSLSTTGTSWLIFDDIIRFSSSPRNWDGEAYILDQKVAKINFWGNLNIKFYEAIQENGEPEIVVNIPTYRGPPGSPTLGYSIIVIDPDRGIAYAFNTTDFPELQRGELGPNTPIRLMVYFDPDRYDEFLEAKLFSMGFLGREETLKYSSPWTGFGSIKGKYPPAAIE